MVLATVIAGLFIINEIQLTRCFDKPRAFILKQIIRENQKREEALLLDFCDLVNQPDQYLGQKVKTKAVIVVVVDPTTDGEAILYLPNCDGKDKRVIVANDSTLSIPDKEFSKLMPVLNEQKDAVLARAEVIVIGTIKPPPSHTFRKYKISLEIVTIETVKRVNEGLSWPSENEKNN